MNMSTEHPQENNRLEAIKTLREMINDIHVAMLTTVAADGHVRSRPMLTVTHEFDGDLWFFTLSTDPKTDEIIHNPRVGLTYSSPTQGRFVSLAGTAEIISNRKKMELMWNDELLEWFPAGVEDPDLSLIRVRVDEAEFWHLKSRPFGYFRSMVSGRPASEHRHERLEWQETTRQ